MAADWFSMTVEYLIKTKHLPWCHRLGRGFKIQIVGVEIPPAGPVNIYRFPANNGSYLFLDNWLVCYAWSDIEHNGTCDVRKKTTHLQYSHL